MQYARADIARAINYAVMEALKQLGKTPVISPDINSTYHAEDPEESSRKWAKAMGSMIRSGIISEMMQKR